MFSISALKTLLTKPNVVKKLNYKIREDVVNGTLLKLRDFLQLLEVKEAGITSHRAKEITLYIRNLIMVQPQCKLMIGWFKFILQVEYPEHKGSLMSAIWFQKVHGSHYLFLTMAWSTGSVGVPTLDSRTVYWKL